MKNLNPHGHRKEISREVRREIKPFEQEFINKIIFGEIPAVLKIYEVEQSNWNLFLMENENFYSIPKKEKDCAPSYFGDIKHAEKYHEFINL